VLSAKVRMNAAINSAGMSMFCWADNRQDANGVYAQNINYDGSGLTGIQKTSETAEKFSLDQNYPNPFNPSTKIHFSIPAGGTKTFVKLTVCDILGMEVIQLVNSELSPGTYSVDWDASKFSSGVYFYRIAAGDFSEVKKMELIK